MDATGRQRANSGGMKVSQFEQKMQNRSKWMFFLYTAVFGSFFLTISAQHPTAIMFVPIADEALFIQQGMNLTSGQWLGNYSAHTLIRGIGYPLFLALDYMTGLPIGIGQGLLYFAAVTYASLVLSKIFRNKIIFFILPVLLLTLPILYAVELQRLLRDYFYLSITLLIFAALFDLLFVKESNQVHPALAVILGLLLGLFWLTREDGIWIVPAIIIALVFAAFQQKRQQPPVPPRVFLVKILTTLASTALVIVATGSMNKLFYGRFVVNEIKDSSFQSAFNAIQRASYTYHRPFLPVPKQARLRIYEQSPSFAKLKSYLDPDGKPSPWNYGCDLEIYRNICGDIAGGWFMWAFRDAAHDIGVHKDPNTAAHFYDAIASEVDAACAQGRLRCLSWLPPLIPYMNLNEVLAVPPHIAHALEFISMQPPISVDAVKSVIDNNARERVLEFLNYPTHFEAPPGVQFNLNGWYKGQGNEWITIEGVGLQDVVKISRDPSPDLVSGFSNPLLDHNRFSIKGSCSKTENCSLMIRDQHEHTINVALFQLKTPSGMAIGSGAINFDGLQLIAKYYLSWRTILYERWAHFILAIKPFSSNFIIFGWLVFLAITLRALYLRQISPTLIAASTLVIAVLGRAILLGLIDASSFPAVQYTYCAPAIPLAMIAATLAIFEGLRMISGASAGVRLPSGGAAG
jgi:hypothetical protein